MQSAAWRAMAIGLLMPMSCTVWRTVTAPQRATRASHTSVISWKRLKPPQNSLTHSSSGCCRA
eukprot:2906444-Alexandrium_andersonii.AAC.1